VGKETVNIIIAIRKNIDEILKETRKLFIET
jgi:hypothetical protein